MKQSLIAQLMALAFAPMYGRIPGENAGRRYHELVDPITADKRNRIVPAYGIRPYVLDLTNARTAVPLGLKGDVWFCDYNSTGVATIQNNGPSEGAMPALALAGLGNLPFDDLFITHAAQPGLVLNLWVGYGAQFIAPTSAIATIGSITNAVKIQDSLGANIKALPFAGTTSSADRFLQTSDGGFAYGAAQKSTTGLAANGTEQVFAAASNVNGAIVWVAEACSTPNAPGVTCISLHANSVVPTTFTDGDVLLEVISNVATAAGFTSSQAAMGRSVRIASGKGLWWLCQGLAEGGIARRRVLYTLL